MAAFLYGAFMKYCYPSYYDDFHCIADKCRHSCCKGWEIDVDEFSYEKYKKIGGELGKELMEKIMEDENGAHMILEGAEERCPFLNERGLCRLILSKGEDILCNICTDHPRFRIFRKNITEEGIGAACEEACRIILSQKNQFKLEIKSDDGIIVAEDSLETEVFEERDNWIKFASRTDLKLSERVNSVLDGYTLNRKVVLSELEYMSEEFREKILRTADIDPTNILDGEYEKEFENLLIYLIFRHPWEGAQVACEVMLCAARIFAVADNKDFENLVEIVRELSSELEYSDENLGIIAENM